ncbi:sensor histidine kinase, partial [Streptomyces calidiresistens]
GEGREDDPAARRAREEREFHLTSAAALLLVTGVLAVDRVPWYGYLLLLVLALWYALTAVPLVRAPGTGRDARAMAWLGGAGTLLVVLVLTSPFSAVLLIVLYAHAFWMLRRLWLATVTVAAVTAACGAAVLVHTPPDRMATVLVLGSTVSSFLIGNEVGRLIRKQAEQERARARLIEDLRDARAELAAAHRLEGAMVERERMSREIHDTLAQGFTSLVMLVQAADAALDSDPGLARRQLELAERTARENLAEARALVAAGQPGVLAEHDLDAVVRRLVERQCEVTGLRCTVHTEAFEDRLTPNERIVLVRSTQESLANIGRHAGAESVTVSLRSDARGTVLDIIDDGRGFAPGKTRGFGLAGMRARIAEVGGELMVTSAPGAGTHVRVVIP